jgi:hypothetical protein
VTFLSTCILLHSPLHTSIESFGQAQPTARMGATLLSTSTSARGVSKLLLISSFYKIECGRRRKLYPHTLMKFCLNLTLSHHPSPQGSHRKIVRWVHRSSFIIRPPPAPIAARYGPNRTRIPPARIAIPQTDLYVDPGWYGTVVVEAEGTNEGLADLQERCGTGIFPPRPKNVIRNPGNLKPRDGRKVFRLMREKRSVSQYHSFTPSKISDSALMLVVQERFGYVLLGRRNG